MYIETFSQLHAKYDLDNFEIIAQAMDKHFGDIFKLDALNSEASKDEPPGSYLDLFDACIKGLAGLYTVDEVVKRLHELLQDDEMIRSKYLENLVFVPAAGLKASSQISYLEKMATSTLKMAEPVTYIDMMRAIQGLRTLKRTVIPPVSVVHLGNLHALDVVKIKHSNQALMVNFNKDLKGLPKWGVVNLQDKANPVVYCETALTEREKRDLEAGLQVQVNQYLDAGANSLPSTGYTALAWLDNQITKAWNFDVNADFAALSQHYSFVQLGGDVTSLTFHIKHSEVEAFCTPAFRRIASKAFSDFHLHSDISSDAFQGGRALTMLGYAAVFGQLEGHPFRPGDIAAVVRISESLAWEKDSIKPFFKQSVSTLPPAFSKTMMRHRNPKLLTDEGNRITLVVPEHIDINELYYTHMQVCGETSTDPGWLKDLPREVPRSGSNEEYTAVMMVLTLIRAMAKKRILDINLPNRFRLNQKEIAFVVATLSENAYITEFQINNNPSLKAIQQQLIPIFARNRWLAESGYRPPMIDDYWKQAAKYWLLHLRNQQLLLEPTEGNKLFKRCVAEMGLKGLEAVLALLKDENERELIERVYGQQQPPFYAAFQPEEVQPYLRALINHLRLGSFFPFSELGISYQSGNDISFIELLEEIDKLKRFDKITLTDCLADKTAFKAFLTRLTRYALDNNWVGLIVIPELEQKENIADDLREMRVIYAQLNNVILRNRHQQSAQKLIKSIKDSSDFADTPPAKDSSDFADTPPAIKEDEKPGLGAHDDADVPEDALEQAMQRALADIDINASWPLKKGGVVQLQLQQQQQIEQTRQVQQQQQKVRAQVLEEALSGELVDYKNIDKLLKKYLAEYGSEHRIFDHCATLKSQDETLLQGFFHTWINANPQVNAHQVIHQMTLDAAKALLRKHRVLTSGLNPDNLPKGFFTQRSKDGDLILCYSPEISYVGAPNVLTIDLDTRLPEAESWEGDFRQFELKEYLNGQKPLDLHDWQYIRLFAQLQPIKDYTADYETFCAQNPRVSRIQGFAIHRNKIIKNWRVFLQAWQYAGMDGVTEFLNKPVDSLTLPVRVARELLMLKQSEQLQNWVSENDVLFDEDSLRALGQVYYRYGDDGVAVLLAKFCQIETNLGRHFFDVFIRIVLRKTPNFNTFMSEAFFCAMDEMINSLRPASAAANKLVWQQIMAKHMHSIGWENVEKLWAGFEYFVAELGQMGLELEGTEFDDIEPENMLVAMDRILESLRHIPQLEKQKSFLLTLSQMDRTHGGVHYALQCEGFKYFNRELELREFVRDETYSPDLINLYRWGNTEATLKMKRALASKARFSFEAYSILSERLGNDKMASRHELMWLLHMQYPATDIQATLAKMDRLDPDIFAIIAQHLHQIVYRFGHINVAINLEAMVDFNEFIKVRSDLDILNLIQHYAHGTLLEAVSILWQSQRFTPADVSQLIALFAAKPSKAPAYYEYFYREGFKLATLLGATTLPQLQQYYDATIDALPVVQNELKLLITQLFSVDYNPSTSNLAALNDPTNWDGLLRCIEEMKANPTKTSEARIAFIEALSQKGIVFKYSKRGEFRALGHTEEDRPEGLGFFVDHEDRILEFMRAHIAVPVDGDAKESLQPIVRFLKVLQLNRTYLNEIEPLLATLEQTKPGLYWSASYFYGLLRALQPDDNKTSFPISLLKVMLQEELICAKELDNVQKDFPQALAATLQLILKNKIFTRNEQSLLCQIALREFNWQNSNELLNNIMTTLAADIFANGRSYALEILVKCKNTTELERQFNNCRWLLQCQSTQAVVTTNWTKTSALWLKALSARESEEALFAKIQSGTIASDPEKQALVLHIVAWSSLYPGLRSSDAYVYELDKKAPKLAERLGMMEMDDLLKIAVCYPGQPSPSADDLVRMMKKRKHDDSHGWDELLDTFMRKPFPEPRGDYGNVASTRDADLQRMLALTQVSRGNERSHISTQHAAELTLIFAYLKRLESGETKILGSDIAIHEMNQQELANAFQHLSQLSVKHPQDALLRAQIWAVLFEVLGRTTRKYPHLAQQFALIANDVCIDAHSRVLQLATGEGKSHFVALRAARNAGLGKTVDVCTAKRTLAQRDLEDYEGLFQYLGLTSAYIHPKSSRESYINSQIHYSTTGDLSLFLDEQSYAGQAIEIPPEQRIALFDEFDFITYDEGRKTQYNYARPTGKTPKQMTWFYQVVNDFYIQSKNTGLIAAPSDRPITRDVLAAFAKKLIHEAGDNEEKQFIVAALLRDPMQLVQWLQSSYEAHELEWGVGFTVREELIEVGEESYPLREIIPLSSDNQKMVGSTFSAGVQQLLAVRLNTEAKTKHEPQNFHIHPESHIISSQVAAHRMQQLWGRWEGFSGTISAAQATALHVEQGTEVLHVPTNQLDLRHWHKPLFFADGHGQTDVDRRLKAIVKQIRICLEKKQSILFSCKNDKQVTELEAQLRTRLTDAELANFIFYTNEDKRTPNAVLDDKSEQEAWQGGKKQNGVVLVASGFGRGDNVGVEAVFLLDVNDTNDMLQKGGRTARNGAEGEVFRFFLSKDLIEDERYLMAFLQASAADVDMEALGNELDKITIEDPDAKRFERVMLLREYVFSLQNAANQGYHQAIAQLSSWGMRLLGVVNDPLLRHNSMLNFSSQLKRLEKRWIQISSDQALCVADKIAAVEQAILQASEVFAQRYTAESGADEEIAPLVLRDQRAAKNKLVFTGVPKHTVRDRAIASICGVLTQLPDLQLNDKRVAKIPQFLAILAGDEHLRHEGSDAGSSDSSSEDGDVADLLAFHTLRLQKFAERVVHCKSTREFVDALEIAAEQVTHPSKTLKVAYEAVEQEIEAKELFEEVEDLVRVEFEQATENLLPKLQEQLTRSLLDSSWLSPSTRIQHVLPVVHYLGTFSPEAQRMWGAEYIERIDQLVNQTPSDLLTLRLNNSKPMSISQSDALWHVASRYSKDHQQLAMLMSLLGDVIEPAPEQRLRLLTKWETWSGGLNKEQSGSFLTSFCAVMQGFQEGRDWDAFESLVKKTSEWWNKGGEAKYQDALMTLWQKLSDKKASMQAKSIPALNELIKWAVTCPGKEWYQLLMRSIELPEERLVKHHNQIASLWPNISPREQTKVEKLEDFSECLEGLNVFYRLPRVFVNGLQEQMLSLDGHRFTSTMGLMYNHSVLLLDRPEVAVAILEFMADDSLSSEQIDQMTDRFSRLMALMQEHQELLAAEPAIAASLLGYMSDTTLSNTQVDHLSGVLLHVARYQQSEHGKGRVERLLSGVDTFKHDTAGLSMLLELYAKDPNHIEEPLFDSIVEYLKNQADENVRSQIEDVAIRFYRAVREGKMTVSQILKVPGVQDLFKFNDPSETVRNQRILFMHLLNQKIFETGGMTSQNEEYQWTEDWNDAVLKHGFEQYVNDTQSILGQPGQSRSSLKRDLTIPQRHALLTLTDEFKLIGSREIRIADGGLLSLSSDLSTILGKYDARWFRSNDRKEQAQQLRQKIEEVLRPSSPRLDESMPTHYEKVLQEIHAARLAAMQSDANANDLRTYKLNRSGSSRYFETLSKMEDMVLRHWTKNSGAIQRLQAYQEHQHRQLKDCMGFLQVGIRQEIQTRQTRLHETSSRPISRFVNGFFGRGPGLLPTLEAIQILLGGLSHKDEWNEAELSELMQKLRSEVKKMPGHLVTLINELLEHGDAIVLHLHEHADRMNSGSRLLSGG